MTDAEREARTALLRGFHCGSEDDWDDTIPDEERRYCGECVRLVHAYGVAVRAATLAEMHERVEHLDTVAAILVALDGMGGA
jgi:ribulose-5-phosphate 4-epimerase/fuculose-1-phosphate aldolase